MHDPAQVDRDIERLSGALWSAVTTLGGADSLALCRELGASATALRRGELEGGRRAFADQIAELSDDSLEDVSRAYALWCHLMNTAEERGRLRTLRARGDHPPDGLAAAIDAVSQGCTITVGTGTPPSAAARRAS